MNDFVRCNKLSGVYWIKGSIEELSIKIKLKPPDDILSLPKFEEYIQEPSNTNLESTVEEYSFKWQEKAFSSWEILRYTDIHNCLTESELDYHNILEQNDISPSKVFTYIHDDYYRPLPKDFAKVNFTLDSLIERLSLNDTVGKLEESFGRKSASVQHLFRSQDNVSDDEKWMAMHVVLDNSDYNEDGALLLKKDSHLLTIQHNIAHNFVILTPDINSLNLNPYVVDDTVPTLGTKYEVNIDFGLKDKSEELGVLLKKLHKKWEKKHKNLVKFIMPPLGKIQYLVTIEISTGKGFGMDNIYVEYNIKLPEGFVCNEQLHGRTHTSESLIVDGEKVWHFGHIIELNLEIDIREEPKPLKLNLEIISVDWWYRHRTEGYTSSDIPLDPGITTRDHDSMVPGYSSSDRQRRMFLGGCHLMNLEDTQDPTMIMTSSGSVTVRSTVISQSPTRGPTLVEPGPSSASSLLLGAEAALRKYKKARAKLAAATRNIAEMGLGDGRLETV